MHAQLKTLSAYQFPSKFCMQLHLFLTLFPLSSLSIHTLPSYLPTFLQPPYIYHTPYTIPLLHRLKRRIDLRQRLPMRNKLINLQLAR